MARTPLTRRIARLTPLAVAAAALAAPAVAAADYPDGHGLIAYSSSSNVKTLWPDGSHEALLAGVEGKVGSFDGTGGKVSVAYGTVARIHVVATGAKVGEVYNDFAIPVAATAMSPDGVGVAGSFSQVQELVKAPDGAYWQTVDYADGRIGWSSQSGKQRIVFLGGTNSKTAQNQSATGDIRIVEQDGTKRSVLAGSGGKNPTISPDGRWIAYEKTVDGQRDVYLLDLETPDAVPFKAADMTGADEYLPAFAPDSATLLFARKGAGTTEVREIPVASIGTSKLVKALDTTAIDGLAWQPAAKPVAGAVTLPTSAAPRVGRELTATGLPSTGAVGETYTWERCPVDPSDAGCTDVTTGTSYTPVQEDVGSFLRVRREVESPAGTDRTWSNVSAAVLAPLAKPTVTKAPPFASTATSETIEFAGTEPGTTFECLVDAPTESGPRWQPCASPLTVDELTVGRHDVLIRQVDGSGAHGEPATVTWFRDALVAPPTITVKPDAASTETTARFEFTGESVAQCSVDGGIWGTCTSPLVLKNRTVGEHSLRIRNFTAHGAGGEHATVTWTVLGTTAPVVEEPSAPQGPAVDAPAAPATPAAPAVPAPAPASAAPAAPASPAAPAAPAAKPATAAKAPALAVTIGGTKSGAQTPGGTASAATIEVAKESVGVGCSITGTVLRSCTVDLYAPRAAGAGARAAAAADQVLVGTGTYASKAGSAKMDVRIALNATGKAMLRANPGGLKVSVKISGQPVSGAPLKATGVAKLVTDRASLTVGGFAVNSAVLTPAAKAQLRRLAAFGKAASVRCVGHTDGSTGDESYLQGLGERRAQAVCSYLALHGVKVARRTLVSKADTVPAASNATKAGRAKNRRVVVTLVR